MERQSVDSAATAVRRDRLSARHRHLGAAEAFARLQRFLDRFATLTQKVRAWLVAWCSDLSVRPVRRKADGPPPSVAAILALSAFLATVHVCAQLAGPTWAADRDLTIGMIVWRGETEAERGFRDRIREMGYTAQYRTFNAGQDRAALRLILSERILPNVYEFDYIYTFGTTASKMTKIVLQNKVPQLFNIVSAPVESGIVSSFEKSGANISGATHQVPVEVQIENALKMLPVKRLGLFFNPRESNAAIQRERLIRAANRLGFEVVDLRSPPALDMLERNLGSIVDKSVRIDAVYLPSDSFLISNAPLIGAKLREARMPSIGSNAPYMKNGVLLGLVADYYVMGRSVAEIVDRHQRGEKLEEIPVQKIYETKEPIFMINETTSSLLNVKIPKNKLENAVLVK